jgi:fermentation-respiration switch protein FrsA (DUF1100 family)
LSTRPASVGCSSAESKPAQGAIDEASQKSSDTNWLDGKDYETWNIISDDGLKLQAYYVSADKPTAKAALLFHGYSAKGKDMAGFARFFCDMHGYNVLMPDARGHGGSEGSYIGFGWPERKDCLKWIQRVVERLGEDCQIILFGISMGGSTVMSASGEELPKQVKAIVEDCGYSTLWGQLSWQLKRIYRLPCFPFMHAASLLIKLRAGYSIREADALAQVKKSVTPTLFIHGEDDTFVPFRMVHEVYDACPSEKDIYVVPGAGHGMAGAVNTEAYESKVNDFIGRYII